jgi:hypothetical protein
MPMCGGNSFAIFWYLILRLIKVIFVYVLLYMDEGFSGVFEFGAWVGFHIAP